MTEEALSVFERYVHKHQFDALSRVQGHTEFRNKCCSFAKYFVVRQNHKLSQSTLLAFIACSAKEEPLTVAQVVRQSELDLKAIAFGLCVMLRQTSLDHTRKLLHLACCLSLVSQSFAQILAEETSVLALLATSFKTLLQDYPASAFDALYVSFAAITARYLRPALTYDRLESLSVGLAECQSPFFLHQLELDFNLTKKLKEAAEIDVVDDPTLEYVVSTLKTDTGEKLSERIRKQTDISRGKGKMKVVDTLIDEKRQETIDHVLSILPDQDPSILSQHLDHPRFQTSSGYDVDKLVSAILENDLPPLSIEAEETPQAKQERRNVFDADTLDSSKLKWTKRQDKMVEEELSEKLKNSIIALAEAPSDDELYEEVEVEDEYKKRGLIEMGLDEYGDDYLGSRVNMTGQDEVHSDHDAEPKPARDDPFSPEIIKILSTAYLEHGLPVLLKVKGKASAAREGLMKQLQAAGWPDKGSDDLIESWAKMLDRDPKKAQRLVPFEWKGNRPATDDAPTTEKTGASGRGRGRGRGNGQRGAHQRRQRGHDKKMKQIMS